MKNFLGWINFFNPTDDDISTTSNGVQASTTPTDVAEGKTNKTSDVEDALKYTASLISSKVVTSGRQEKRTTTAR